MSSHEHTEDEYPYWEDYPIQFCANCKEEIAIPVHTKHGGVYWKFQYRGKMHGETRKSTYYAKGKCRYCGSPFALELMPQQLAAIPRTGPLIVTWKETPNAGTRSITNGQIICQCGQRISWVDKHQDTPCAMMKIGPTLIRETIVVVPPIDWDSDYGEPNEFPMEDYYVFTSLIFTDPHWGAKVTRRGSSVPSWRGDGPPLNGLCQSCKRQHFIESDERLLFLRRRVRELEAKK